MSVLPSGLIIFDYGTQGWNSAYSNNFELIDERFVEMILADKVPGDDSILELTDNSTGTPGASIENVTATPDQAIINSNFASLNAKVSAILQALKKTDGVGILADDPP